METFEIASGGTLAIASMEEIQSDFAPNRGRAIVCLVRCDRPFDDPHAALVEYLLEIGCDYFALWGPYSTMFHDGIDILIESRAPTPIDGRDEIPGHATTAELEGTPEDVAAVFLHCAGAAFESRRTTIWLAVDPDSPNTTRLREALAEAAAG